MKKTFFFVIVFASLVYPQFKVGEAKGIFMALGVGPRFPISSMANYQNIGVGANVTFSYTDNELIPVFFYTTVAYHHFPGRQDLYKKTDYASYSSNVISILPGMRFYFKPIFEQVIILMPIIDIGAEYSLFETWHQFKTDTNKNNFVEEKNKFGFHAGVGASMFLIDFIAYYNYMKDNQFISIDMRVNLPVFVKI